MKLAIIPFILVLAFGPAASSQSLDAWNAAVDAAVSQGVAGQIGLTDRAATLSLRVISVPGRPHRLGEIWRWASVTKQITATLLMQEVAAGHLSLEDRLKDRLPNFKGATAPRITLRMLLQHTSGLPNPDDTPAANPQSMPGFYTRSKLGSGIKADAFSFCAGVPKADPGIGFAYNNCDYILLGALLEHVTGQSFAQLVQARIAKPLNLHSLALAGNKKPVETVRGFMDANQPEPAFNLAAFGASGALYGDPADLLAFDRGLLGDEILTAAAKSIAWQGDPELGYVALGAWAFPAPLKGCKNPVQLIERRGEIGGIEVRNILAPDIGRAFIIFADRSDIDFGEIWQGKGITFDLASTGFCQTEKSLTEVPN
jgi:CubicO group peptidase (beta-lactamase class C family)